MRSSQITGIATAAFFSVTLSAFAQTPTTQAPTPQTPTPQASEPQTKTTPTAATQTFTGCLMSEPDYRRAHNLGEGTVGGGRCCMRQAGGKRGGESERSELGGGFHGALERQIA